ncbi:MAG: hypothetical protein ACR2MB_04300 [Acidimicrobiales bacterium]
MADEQDRVEALDEDKLGEAPPEKTLDAEVAMLSEDDVAGGDPSLRDVATEEPTGVPAEEAAMHVVDETLGGFDSEVDDPELAAAYEIDPEVER